MNSSPSTLWRNLPFQRLFWAHVNSLFGSGLSSVALGLLAHQLVGASASAVLGITLAIRIIVIVLCAPWAGLVADRFGARTTMIASDLFRAGIVVGFFFVGDVWHIYALAVFLNLGATIFTPVYKAGFLRHRLCAWRDSLWENTAAYPKLARERCRACHALGLGQRGIFPTI